MKRRFFAAIVIVALIVALIPGISRTARATGGDWKNAMADLIFDQYSSAPENRFVDFAIIDMDFDGIPELCIGTGRSDTQIEMVDSATAYNFRTGHAEEIQGDFVDLLNAARNYGSIFGWSLYFDSVRGYTIIAVDVRGDSLYIGSFRLYGFSVVDNSLNSHLLSSQIVPAEVIDDLFESNNDADIEYIVSQVDSTISDLTLIKPNACISAIVGGFRWGLESRDDIYRFIGQYEPIEYTQTVSSTPGAGGWSELYRTFVMDGRYLELGQRYELEEIPYWDPIMFALYDMDGDGIPELFIFNGGLSMAERTNYVYTLSGNYVVYAGAAGFRESVLTYIADTRYPGVFCEDGNMGYYRTYYYYFSDGVVQIEFVSAIEYEDTSAMDEYTETRETEDEALYDASKTTHERLQFYSLAEIQSMTWDEFASRAVFPAGSTSDSEYEYDQPPPGGGFRVSPELWRRITDAQSANAAIYEAIASMTPEQRRSGDALDMAALFIETAVRAGASRKAAGEVSLSAGVLGDLSGTARGILASADNSLMLENVSLLRNLRTNISIRTEETESLIVSFTDNVSGVAFDNVTVEAEFASVTLNRNSILNGGKVEVRIGEPGDGSARSSDPGDGGGQDNPGRGGDESFWDIVGPLDFWSVGVVALILVLWRVLASRKHRFRSWVVPAFCALAVGINVCTILFFNARYKAETAAGRPGTYEIDGNTQNDGSGESGQNDGTTLARIEGGIEVIMSEGVRATVSLPAVGGEKDYLVLLNEDGIPQYSKYNPVTDMIDTRIRESGVYTLREYSVSFVDVEQKNELMKEAISQLASRNIMTGTTDGFFFPDKPITRAELVSAIIRAFDLVDPDATSTFADMDRSDWYYSAIASAQREGIVEGFADNTFRGDVDIPKDQLVVVTANTLIERMGYIVPGEIEELLAVFFDRVNIAGWSEGRVALAAQSNILIYRTDSLFAPRSIMTRGDAAIILYRVFNKVW